MTFTDLETVDDFRAEHVQRLDNLLIPLSTGAHLSITALAPSLLHLLCIPHWLQPVDITEDEVEIALLVWDVAETQQPPCYS